MQASYMMCTSAKRCNDAFGKLACCIQLRVPLLVLQSKGLQQHRKELREVEYRTQTKPAEDAKVSSNACWIYNPDVQIAVLCQ